MARIVVGDRDGGLGKAISREFGQADHDLVLLESGRDVLDVVSRDLPDLVILGDGLDTPGSLEVCRVLRAESTVPIVIVSAERAEIDRIIGLELGADDYAVQPIKSRELLARVRALFRRIRLDEERSAEARGDLLRVGDLIVDLRRHLVFLSSRPVILKPREFDLLAFLASHPGEVYSRADLLQAVWGQGDLDGTRTVDIHLSCLRQKIEAEPGNPVLLQTVRGVGYRFVAPEHPLRPEV